MFAVCGIAIGLGGTTLIGVIPTGVRPPVGVFAV
jgi:hypothetical protein